MFYSHGINVICWIKPSRSIGRLGVNRFPGYPAPLITCLGYNVYEIIAREIGVSRQSLWEKNVSIFSIYSLSKVTDIFLEIRTLGIESTKRP